MALWQDARDNDVAVRDFVTWFRKNVKKMLWRPTWEAAKAGDQATYNGGDDDDDPCAIYGVSTLPPNGMPMRDVLVCGDCYAEVHLACSGFKKVPRGSYKCGCREVVPTMISTRILMTAKTTTVMVRLNLTTTLTSDEEWR